jgi:hypothetical protein
MGNCHVINTVGFSLLYTTFFKRKKIYFWWKLALFGSPILRGHPAGFVQKKHYSHRCTRVENPGEGVRDVFAKIPRGVISFRENCRGGSTYFSFYCIFINKFFENLPGGVLFHTPFPPYPPPLCASMITARTTTNTLTKLSPHTPPLALLHYRKMPNSS